MTVLTDPLEALDVFPMTLRQIVVVMICVLINAIDGFDILSISLASPGIAEEWRVGSAALGWLLSAELIGMGLGSFFLGQLADRIGRRPVVLTCLSLMTAGMLGAAFAPTFGALAIVRVAIGLGIGGMLPSLSAIAAESSNRRRRALGTSMMAAGYPAGAVVGGALAAPILAGGEWRGVFLIGAAFSLAMLPLALFLIPESLGGLLGRGFGARDLAAVNTTLRRLGHSPIAALSEKPLRVTKGAVELFSNGMRRSTLLLTSAYFLHMISFYFFLKWVPKIVVSQGFTAAQGGSVLVWANIGGLVGSVLFSVMSARILPMMLAVVALLGSFGFVTLFGQVGVRLDTMIWTAAVAGLFTNAVVVCLYAIIAQVYPDHMRAGGAGFSLGVGRAGAALGPIAAGTLFGRGAGPELVAPTLASASLLAVGAIVGLMRNSQQTGPRSHQV